jgi:protein-disulfide isomerase
MTNYVAPLLSLFLLASAASADTQVLATVDGTEIQRADVEKLIRPQLIELDNNRYQVMRGALENLIAAALLDKEAAARSITRAELEEKEVTSKLTSPSEEEVTELFEANKAQLGGATLEDVHDRIVDFLRQQQAAELRNTLVMSLRKKFKTTISLEVPRIEVSDAGRASRGGGPNAPIQIIAFSDYECPYCRLAEVTVEQVIDKYGDKLNYVLRDYPLPFHPAARGAARAARCAGEQKKFWEYHDALWKADGLGDEQLESLAAKLELDKAAFDTCLASDKYNSTIDEDLAAGAELGVNGTPAFFVNGRMMSGAQPLEAFVQLIDEELALKEN